jgi:hypothetical protein
MAITARGNLNGHDLTDVPVLNPGDWFGKAWLIEIGGSYTPLFLIVEADSVCDAIDELAEHEKFGHNIVVADEDLGDYDLDTCHYSGAGQVLDLDHLMIHGQEGSDCPFPCRYFGDGLPEEGVVPTEFEHQTENFRE